MADTASNVARMERLEARVNREQKELFVRAAQLSGVSLTSFVVSNLTGIAKRIVSEHELLELTRRDREAFVDALLNPPKPNKKLRETARYYKKTMG